MRQHIILAASALLMSLVVAKAALAASKSPFEPLDQAVSQALKSGKKSTADRVALQDMQASVRELTNIFQQSTVGTNDPSPLREEYTRSLLLNTQALRKLPAGDGERSKVISEVKEDLALKVKFAGNGLGFAGGFPAVVKVTVETVRAGVKVDGLWVRCNPLRYGVSQNPEFVFNSATSPTTAALPPGLFMLWVESPDKKVLASQPVKIGDDGSESETIRFALP